jgi:hypothetical protein
MKDYCFIYDDCNMLAHMFYPCYGFHFDYHFEKFVLEWKRIWYTPNMMAKFIKV